MKHLEFIQAVISRMNSNSFRLKGWAITLVLALIALAIQKKSLPLFPLALVPSALFWTLDSYFLSMEAAYRRLYDEIRTTDEEDIDFRMDVESKAFKSGWLKAMFSTTILLFHGLLLICVVTLTLINYLG